MKLDRLDMFGYVWMVGFDGTVISCNINVKHFAWMILDVIDLWSWKQ